MLKVGLTNEMKRIVEGEHLASVFGSGLVDALATPALVGFCEECARLAVEHLLADGQKTVGTRIDLRHLAATPVGMEVTVQAKLVKVDGRRLLFTVEASDEEERICEAEHERFIIDSARFARRVADKRRSGS